MSRDVAMQWGCDDTQRIERHGELKPKVVQRLLNLLPSR